MPLILSRPNDKGTRDLLIVLGPENIERMQEKDPFQVNWNELPMQIRATQPGAIVISYATDAEMMQMIQLARQGKMAEAIDLATSGFKFRPELGDHDLGPERLR
jgi:hypothetical protein